MQHYLSWSSGQLLESSRIKGGSYEYRYFNPVHFPGASTVLMCASETADMSSVLSTSLATKSFVESYTSRVTEKVKDDAELLESGIEAALRFANCRVYEFSNKMTAGGRFATSAIAASKQGRSGVVARSGAGQAYLIRNRKLYPFFSEDDATTCQTTRALLGVSSVFTADIVTVEFVPGDRLFLLPFPATKVHADKLSYQLTQRNHTTTDFETFIGGVLSELSAIFMIEVGPETLFLSNEHRLS